MSRETHRQIALSAVPWRDLKLSWHYLHNRRRKLGTSQLVSWFMFHLRRGLPSLEVYGN